MIVEFLKPISPEAVVQLSENDFLAVTTTGSRIRETHTHNGQPFSVTYTNRSELLERLTSRKQRNGPFLWRLAQGKSLSGPGETFISMAAEAWEKGPQPLTPSEASSLWEDIHLKRDAAARAGGTNDAPVLIDMALWTAVEVAFALACRWSPPPGQRISRLSDIDLQLFVAARDVAQLASSAGKLEGLKHFISVLKELYPPPVSFTRKWEVSERGGPFDVFWIPIRFFIDMFRRERSRLWPIWGMLRLLRPYWKIPATLFVFDIVSSLLLVPVPFLASSIWHSQGTNEILIGCGIIAFLVVFDLVVTAVKEAYESSAVSLMWLQWQLKFVQRILHRKTRYSPGEVFTRFEDAEAAFDGTISIVTSFATGLAYLLPTPIFILLLPAKFLAQIFILILCLGVIYAVFSALVYHYSAGIARLRGQTNERMVEVLGKAEPIRAMRIVRDALRRVREKARPFRDEQVKLHVISSVIEIGIHALATLGPIVLIAQAIIAVKRGELDPGFAFGMGAWLALIMSPIHELFSIGPHMQRVLVRARRFLEVYRQRDDTDASAPQAVQIRHENFPDRPKILRLDQLTYHRPGTGNPLWTLHGKFELAGLTAITGPSGVGKTTFLLIVNRTVLPSSGEIRIDKVPINSISEAEWSKNVVMVPTEDVIFHGSVLENLTLGQQAPTDATEAERILKKVKLWEMIEERGGLLLKLEGPASLSHGERKRMALARALLRKPKLLLLDEVIDALDPGLEAEIMELLREYSEIFGCAIFFVVHRPDAIKPTDQRIHIAAPDKKTEPSITDDNVEP